MVPTNPVFSGKTALIYGAASGIGRAVALEFARRGGAVAIADIQLDGAQETARLIEVTGGRSLAIRCDVTSDVSVREAAVKTEIALGQVDIVMNNVGGILHGNPQDIPISEWQRIIDLNLMPVVRSNAVFLPKMLARGSGFIINTASFAGLYPFGHHPHAVCGIQSGGDCSDRIPGAASGTAGHKGKLPDSRTGADQCDGWDENLVRQCGNARTGCYACYQNGGRCCADPG